VGEEGKGLARLTSSFRSRGMLCERERPAASTPATLRATIPPRSSCDEARTIELRVGLVEVPSSRSWAAPPPIWRRRMFLAWSMRAWDLSRLTAEAGMPLPPPLTRLAARLEKAPLGANLRRRQGYVVGGRGVGCNGCE